MDTIRLKRTLNSIGSSCFVKYFSEFKDNLISNDALTRIISKNENYKYSATKTRVNSARRIIKNNLEYKALEVIIQSAKVDSIAKEKANNLLRTST